jgi:hypothetical protein
MKQTNKQKHRVVKIFTNFANQNNSQIVEPTKVPSILVKFSVAVHHFTITLLHLLQ